MLFSHWMPLTWLMLTEPGACGNTCYKNKSTDFLKSFPLQQKKKPTHRGYSGFPEAQGYQFNQLLFSFQDGEQQKPTKVHFRTQSRDLPQEELFEFRLGALFVFAPQFRLVLTSLLARIC